MIIDKTRAQILHPEFSWHHEAANDERLKLGRRYRKWLTFRYLCQTDQPTPSWMQGVMTPGEPTLEKMWNLGLIAGEDRSPRALAKTHVTRDGQAAVTWWYNVWAPFDCAPTWGLPILCAIPGNDRWPDRFYAMRGEWRGDELLWVTPRSGTTFTDKWTDGVWRALP